MNKPVASIVIRQLTGLTDLRDLTSVQSAITSLFDQFLALRASLPTKEIREQCRYELHQSQHEVKIFLFPEEGGRQDAEDLFGGSLGHDLSRLVLDCLGWCASDQSAREDAERNHVMPEYTFPKTGAGPEFVFDKRLNKVRAPSREAFRLVEACRGAYRHFVNCVVGSCESGEWSISVDGEGLAFRRPIKISPDLKVDEEASELVTIDGRLKGLDHPMEESYGKIKLVQTTVGAKAVFVLFSSQLSDEVVRYWGSAVRVVCHETVRKEKKIYVLKKIGGLQGRLKF